MEHTVFYQSKTSPGIDFTSSVKPHLRTDYVTGKEIKHTEEEEIRVLTDETCKSGKLWGKMS